MTQKVGINYNRSNANDLGFECYHRGHVIGTPKHRRQTITHTTARRIMSTGLVIAGVTTLAAGAQAHGIDATEIVRPLLDTAAHYISSAVAAVWPFIDPMISYIK